MPTYLYKCDQCGIVEVKHGMTEHSPYECPDCNSTNFRRVFKTGGVHFKGSGFYSTDKDK